MHILFVVNVLHTCSNTMQNGNPFAHIHAICIWRKTKALQSSVKTLCVNLPSIFAVIRKCGMVFEDIWMYQMTECINFSVSMACCFDCFLSKSVAIRTSSNIDFEHFTIRTLTKLLDHFNIFFHIKNWQPSTQLGKNNTITRRTFVLLSSFGKIAHENIRLSKHGVDNVTMLTWTNRDHVPHVGSTRFATYQTTWETSTITNCFEEYGTMTTNAIANLQYIVDHFFCKLVTIP
mmetsp:Transcript_10528/g.15814  ORF Transcript_10528/g.15814 Transcript_10528/m.15814 type:complete len:233 (-) Transcript_10528:2329-3027(-)